MGNPFWSANELATLETILRTRKLHHSDAAAFPNRTLGAVKRAAKLMRAKIGIARPARGRPILSWELEQGQEPKTMNYWTANAVNGSALLHKRTVEMCLRNGITLPGKSRAETMAIAVKLHIVTPAQAWRKAA